MKTTTELQPDIPVEIVKELSKNWWVFLLRGILLVILGIYALTVPALTLAMYTQILGFFLMADSVMAFILWLTQKVESRSWHLVRSLVTMLVGVFIFAHPLFIGAMVVVTLILILAFHSIVSGALEIYVAVRDRKEIKGEGWMMLSGAFSILFGAVLLSAPILTGRILIQLSGAMAILFGLATIFVSFRIKSLKQSA